MGPRNHGFTMHDTDMVELVAIRQHASFDIDLFLCSAFAKAHTVCGTIGYLAPEILKNVPYGKKW